MRQQLFYYEAKKMGGIMKGIPAFKEGQKATNIMHLTPWKYKDAIKSKKKEWDIQMKPEPAKPVEPINYDPVTTESPDLEEEARRRRAGRRAPTVLSQTNTDTLG